MTRNVHLHVLLFAITAFISCSQQAFADLEDKLQRLIDAHQGQVSVAICNLDNRESFEHRANAAMPTASLIKLAVMIEAYRQAEAGKLDLEQMLTLRDADKVPGSGILTAHFTEGACISVRDAIRLMIVYSDNTATNMVLDQIGLRATSEFMEELGLPNTKIHAKVFRGETSVFPERSKEFGLGSTTAKETLQLFIKLHNKEIVSEEACQEMLGHLEQCDDDTKIKRSLPAGIRVAQKTGAVSTVRSAGGIIYSPGGAIAICVLTSENKDRGWKTDNAGNRLCAEVARVAYKHFNSIEKSNDTGKDTPLRVGSSGRLVESLQRTLNARLEPSPELSVDGEFGPITKAALVRFQQQNRVEANGEIGPDTWTALGPLVTNDPPVPDPEVVNSEKLDVQLLDALSGPPFVTCGAWAIADADGKILWSQKENKVVDIASTTKIMTAYIVLKIAEKTPKSLGEQVVFSERAANTIGSTCNLRVGEQVSVRECLYGLLLPSGNDAAVALAEHFGERLAPKDPGSETVEPFDSFVASMNDSARSLGMSNTTFRNPHGLTQTQHQSTASDLVRLAHAALQMRLFRDIVRVRQRGCTVTGAGGYRRNLVWKNTNRLLGIDGYTGVKTGTTTAAGACLVSRAVRGDDELLMVVLGAKSTESRYVDARNLYRWAWLQRGHRE